VMIRVKGTVSAASVATFQKEQKHILGLKD
jgi:hypothetical protein